MARGLLWMRLLLPHFSDALHQFRMTSPGDAGFFRRSVEFGMEIVTAFTGALFLFDRHAVRVGPCILTNAGHLPCYLDVGFIGLDDKAVVGDLAGDDHLRELPDRREL